MTTLVLALLLAAPPASHVSVVTPETPILGAPLELMVLVEAPPSEVELETVKPSDDYQILGFEAVGASQHLTTLSIVIQPLAVGEITIEGIELSHAGRTFEATPLKITIPDPLANIADPKLQAARGLRPVFWTGWLFLIAILIGVIAALLYLARRKPAAVPVAPALPDNRPAWMRALERLQALQPPSDEDPEAARVRVDAISDVLRKYIEERFEVQAPDRTTEEFLTEIVSHAELSVHHGALEEFLGRCDWVKFTGEEPSRDSVVQVLSDAMRFVREAA